MIPQQSSWPSLAEWILLVLLAGFSAVLFMRSEPLVSIHYSFTGEPDLIGNRLNLLAIPLTGILVFILLKWVKRFSKRFNYPLTITPENIHKQEQLAFLLLDAYAIITLIVFNFILLHLLFIAETDNSSFIWIWGGIVMISYLAPIPIYLRKALRP